MTTAPHPEFMDVPHAGINAGPRSAKASDAEPALGRGTRIFDVHEQDVQDAAIVANFGQRLSGCLSEL